MDPFDDLLRGVRADGDGLSRTELSPPWSLRFADDEASLTLCTPLRGEGWITRGPDGSPRPLRAGDVVVTHGPGPLLLTDRPPGSPAPPADRTVLLVGTYRVRAERSRWLLAVLPPVLMMPASEESGPLLDFLDADTATRPQGRRVVLDRLLDWLLVCTLRGWFDQSGEACPGWFRALGDEVTGPVLRAMHAAPGRAWTLAALAREAGVSRTALAQRFADLVGRPPLTYLTDWRMALAADLLTGSAATVAAVAHQVGYADAFGFSSAFKRVHGVSPTAYRGGSRTVATGGRAAEECTPVPSP